MSVRRRRRRRQCRVCNVVVSAPDRFRAAHHRDAVANVRRTVQFGPNVNGWHTKRTRAKPHNTHRTHIASAQHSALRSTPANG